MEVEYQLAKNMLTLWRQNYLGPAYRYALMNNEYLDRSNLGGNGELNFWVFLMCMLYITWTLYLEWSET